jgi:hypothetical protein
MKQQALRLTGRGARPKRLACDRSQLSERWSLTAISPKSLVTAALAAVSVLDRAAVPETLCLYVRTGLLRKLPSSQPTRIRPRAAERPAVISTPAPWPWACTLPRALVVRPSGGGVASGMARSLVTFVVYSIRLGPWPVTGPDRDGRAGPVERGGQPRSLAGGVERPG